MVGMLLFRGAVVRGPASVVRLFCRVCCCVSCVPRWPCLVACLPVWRRVWLVAVPPCPVCLALCSGRGFGLCGGGFCRSRLFLACWCVCRAAGGRAVQGVKNPPSGNQQPGEGIFANRDNINGRPQKTARRRYSARAYESEITGAAPVGGFLRRSFLWM